MHTLSHPHRAPHSILAAGERVPQAQLRDAWDSPDIQRTLFAARQRFGHALCECRPEPLKLQIRLRDDKCHLAVWPQERPAHDSECIFFHDEIAERASAVAALRAAVASAPPGPKHPPAPSPAERQRTALWGGPACRNPANTSPVTIKSLGQRLWEVASLCRWHPDWTRDWGRTRYQLQIGAAEFSLDGTPLERLLFVPRPYREPAAGVLNQEWEAFVRSLLMQPKQGSRLLIAPVRRVLAPHKDRPAAVFLRHLRAPIGLTPACFDFISRDCRNVLTNSHVGAAQRGNGTAEPSCGRFPELIGFFFLEGHSRACVWARAGWLMAVHPSTYIPAASSNAVMLVDALVSGRYAFQHLISEAPPGRRSEPDLLVRHVRGPDGVPVARAALELMSPSVSAEYLAARRAIAVRMADQGIPTWVWTPNGKPGERRVPQLPPPDRTPTTQAAQQLQQIFASAHADYRYGFSNKFFERKSS